MHRSILSRPVFAAAVAMLATAAVPAMASTNPTGNPGGSAAPMPSEQPAKKICLSPTVSGAPLVTGSILAKRTCHTRAEWEAKGVTFKTK